MERREGDKEESKSRVAFVNTGAILDTIFRPGRMIAKETMEREKKVCWNYDGQADV